MTALILGLVLLTSPVSQAAATAQATDSCECETQRPVNLATVNGTPIPTSLIESDTVALVEPMRRQLDQARENALQSVITSRLLEVEATKRGVSLPQLLQTEVVAKADEPTEGDLRTFYERNRQGIPEPFEQIKENLRQYVRSQRQQVQMTILTTDLRTSAKIEIL